MKRGQQTPLRPDIDNHTCQGCSRTFQTFFFVHYPGPGKLFSKGGKGSIEGWAEKSTGNGFLSKLFQSFMALTQEQLIKRDRFLLRHSCYGTISSCISWLWLFQYVKSRQQVKLIYWGFVWGRPSLTLSTLICRSRRHICQFCHPFSSFIICITQESTFGWLSS